jgi:hypothetical protein
MRSSGITLIAEERAAQRHRARVRALGLIVAVAMSLGAIYASGDSIGGESPTVHNLDQATIELLILVNEAQAQVVQR